MTSVSRHLRWQAWLAWALLLIGASAGANAELLRASSTHRPAAAIHLPALEGALRSRRVDVNRVALADVAQTLSERRTPPLLQIGFFDDVVMQARIDYSERTASGGLALVGHVDGDAASSVVLVDNGGTIAIGARSATRRYSVFGSSETGYQATETLPADATASAMRDDAPLPPVHAAEPAATGRASGANSKLLLDDGSSIDLMILYTASARAASGGTAQIQANIDAQVAFINAIYQNSGVVQRLRLVHAAEINLQEGSPFDNLYQLNLPYDGVADEVQVLRDVYRADLVSVWGNWPQFGGVAYLGTPEGLSVLPYYAVSLVGSPLSTHPTDTVMAHELGHNMGLQHDPLNSPGNTQVTPAGSTTLTTIGYAHGYVDSINRFRTLMSYDSCYTSAGYLCRELPMFANPALTHDNSSWYPAAVPAPLGNASSSDERRALDDTRDSVANYRQALASLSGPGIVSFDLDRVSVAEAAGTLTLRVMRRAGSSGAISVDYASVAGSAAADSDYTSISGTLSWADGDSSERSLLIPITQDAVLEGLEDFSVVLSAPSGGASIGGHNNTGASTRVTINDDEPDTFPLGDAIPPGYSTPGASPGAWSVDRTRGYQSTASLQSAVTYMVETSPGVFSDSYSDLNYTGEFATGTIRFAHMLSSSAQSKLEFMIDNVVVYTQPGGQTDWAVSSHFITAGTHSLRWRFTNLRLGPCADEPIWINGGRRCESRAWIDQISLPLGSVTPTSHYAYIANNGSGTVSVIDLTRPGYDVVATVAVGTNPVGVAAHPDGTRVYVSNGGSASVSVIDTFTQSVSATIPVGDLPHGIAVSPDGTRVYVANSQSNYLAVIDTASNTRLPNIPSAFSGVGLAIHPDGSRAYMGINNGSAVQVLDLLAGSPITTTPLSNKSFGVAVSPDGARAYVVQNQAGRVAIVNTSNNAYSNWFNVPGQPIGVAVSRATAKVYATTGSANSLAIFDPASGNVATVPVGSAPYGVAVDHSGARVLVTNSGSNSVSILDTSVNAVLATVAVGSNPRSTGDFIAPVSVPGPPRALLAGPAAGQLTLSFEPPLSDGGLPISQYAATCLPGGFVAGGSQSPLVVTGLSNGTAYQCTVTATNSRGIGAPSTAVTATPGNGTFFTSPAATTFSVFNPGSFQVQTSGLPATNFSISGSLPAGVSFDDHGLLAGTPASGSAGTYPLVITVSNGTPPDMPQLFTLTVARAPQAINFAALPDRSLTEGSFALQASGTASGIALDYSSLTPTICSVAGSTVNLLDGGTCTLAADQPGNVDYSPAPQVQRSFMVRRPQTIVYGPAPAMVYGIQRQLSASGGGSGNPVRFSSATPAICTTTELNGFALNGVGVGSCTVMANQAGNYEYDAAPPVALTLNVAKAPQQLSFASTPLQIGQSARRDTSIGGSSMPVILQSATPGVCVTDGLLINAVGPGTCRFSANQAGDANYEAAPEVQVALISTTMMGSARSHHSATRLADGRVLVVGGQTTGGVIFASAEIYDPATRQWTATGSLSGPRMEHTAVALPDGRVLVVGGMGDNFVLIAAAEIYDPATGSFSAAGSLNTPRRWHTASLLDGNPARVLVAGGQDSTSTVLASTEIYSAASNDWTAAAPLVQPRFSHTSILLTDGRLMISAGARASNTVFGSSELYNPATNTWTAASSTIARFAHTATRLNDGSVLLAGGTANAVLVAETVRYQPVANSWSSAGTLALARSSHSATLLANGRVLLAGGATSSGISANNTLYDPVSQLWTATSPLLMARRGHTATLLQDGSVLIAGGIMSGGNQPRTNIAELYRPALTLLAATLPAVAINTPYPPLSMTTDGGLEPLAFSVSAGALPSGMTLSTTGLLSGTPTSAGSFNFTVTVSDANQQTATQSYTLAVGYLVTATAGANGSITPANERLVTGGTSAQYTVSADASYAANVTGTCGGTLNGAIYTTQPIQSHCTVIANFVSTALPPGAPLIGVATAGSAQASVSFTPPVDDGGAPIEHYTATSTPGGLSASCNAPCSNITVGGLSNGTSYRFRVNASNRAGSGADSAESNEVTPLQAQSISFGQPPVVQVGFSSQVNVSGGGSGNPVVLSNLTPSVCGLAGNSLSGISVGTCQITANQAGNASYFAAPQVVLSVEVRYRLHTVSPAAGDHGNIAPASPFSAVYGTVRTLTLTPYAGYTGLVSGSCGGTLAGNVYTTAPIVADCSVIAQFAQPPGAPAIGTASAGDTQATISFAPPASDGGSAIVRYTASSTPGGLSASCNAPCTAISVGGLSNGTSYQFVVYASNAVGDGPLSAASASVTPQAPQQISFGAAPSILVGASGLVSASGGGSGNPVVFGSQTPLICSASGDQGATITGLMAGSCVIAANQAGNAAYVAAPEVTLSFPITATFQVTPSAGANGTIAPASVQTVASGATVSFTLTPEPGYSASVGGSCGGTLAGNLYTTAAISTDCSVIASFSRAPDAPVGVSASPLSGAARLSFSAPLNDGGSPILDYQASCTPGAHTANGASSPIDVSGLTNQSVYRCSVRARNAVGLGAASAEVSVIPGASGSSANLAISKSNGLNYVNGAAPVDYLINVSNPGPAGVIGARVEDALAPDFAAATWTCTPLANARCGASSGSGALDLLVDLPANSSVQIQFSALPAPGPELPLSNIASVTPPAAISDPNLGNNTAMDGPDVRGLFRNGFE